MDRGDAAATLRDQVSRLASPELYTDEEDVVIGYDSSGSCLCGAPRPTPALEQVDPARRWSDGSQRRLT